MYCVYAKTSFQKWVLMVMEIQSGNKISVRFWDLILHILTQILVKLGHIFFVEGWNDGQQRYVFSLLLSIGLDHCHSAAWK